jgi:hypothetical protein
VSGPWEKYSASTPDTPGPWGKYTSGFGEKAKAALNTVEQREEGIDYSSGVADAAFRAGFSRMSDDAEKANYLNVNVGQGMWGKDKFGAYYINPEGMRKFGVKSDKPVSIDEQRTTGYDVADWGGDAPAIAGGVGVGMAATGLGAIPGLVVAGLGAAGGKAIDEVVKNVQGYRRRGAQEIGESIAGEGAMSMAGEGAFRVLRPIAKKLVGPGAERMTSERVGLAKAAQDQGFHIRPGQVTDAPILSRWEGMVQAIFGDLYGEQNKRAAAAGMERLGEQAGRSPGRETAGQILSDSLRSERVKFGEAMSARYGKIDQLVGKPFVPTDPVKKVAKDILDAMPKTQSGDVVFASPETQKFLTNVMNLENHLTTGQMQQVRTILREASESSNLVPGIDKYHARLLRKAADEAFTAAAGPENAARAGADPIAASRAVELLRITDAEYKDGIRRFANPLVTRITRDATRTGSIDPDMVVDYVIKPNHPFRVRQIKDAVPAETWSKVKSAHAEDLVQSIVKETDDPFKQVFDGRAFRDALNKYGRNTLEEVHGKEWTQAAYKYADSLMLASKKAKLSGGIVAANVALHPVANLPKLIWLRALVKVMEQPGTFKYLTEGLQLGPETKAGAAALTRFTTQLIAQAEDETGSARFNITEPPQ